MARDDSLDLLQQAYEKALENDGGYVTLVGDLMVDLWIRGRVSRMSPEDSEVPVLLQEEADMSLGGAGLVFQHLRSMGLPAVKFVTICGYDEHRMVAELLGDCSHVYMLEDQKRPTTIKSRIVIKPNQQIVRVDRESTAPITGGVQTQILARLRDTIGPQCRLVLVSDYDKGLVTGPVMKLIRERCKEHDVPFIVDPAKRLPQIYEGSALLTPNSEEFDFFKATASASVDGTCVTKGRLGMELYRDYNCMKYPATTDECVDAVGAGDMVVAAIAAFMSGGAPVELAVQMANAVAGWYVSQEGTVSPSRHQVEKLIAHHAQWFKMEDNNA